MNSLLRRSLVALSLIALPLAAFAQTPAAPSPAGHWEGSADVAGTPLPLEIDIAKDAAGALTATFGQPAQGVRGLPLSDVKADGLKLTFVLKAGPATSTFAATLSEDGKTMTGTIEQGGRSLPFTATRNGDAKMMAAPKSTPVAKEFEGTWTGVIEFNGQQMHLALKLANQADGAAKGSIQNTDIAGPELAVGITQKDKTLTFDVPAIGGAYTGTLNAEGTEIAGQWSQAGASLPLVFKKPAK
jgi:hypothetical protein